MRLALLAVLMACGPKVQPSWVELKPSSIFRSERISKTGLHNRGEIAVIQCPNRRPLKGSARR